MKPGEPFDPVDVTRRLKLYPVDVVDARRDLSDGPKRLYQQLFRIAVTTDRRKNRWPGYTYASEKFLAERLGKSESGIRRDSAALRDARLVSVDRPNRTTNNRYSFLWDAAFDSADVSGQEVVNQDDDRANVSARDRADVSAHICSDSADLGGRDSADVSGLYKEKQHIEATQERSASQSQGGFLEFQAAYPEPKQKIKIDSSCRAYVSGVSGKPGEHGRLMAGLARYKASVDWQRSLSRDGGRYVPTMERFIAEHRYLDHPPAADEAPEGRNSTLRRATAGRWDPVTEEFLPVEAVQ